MIMTRRPNGQVHRRRRAGAFTLMELLVVIGVMALVAAAAVPSIWHVFSAGSEAQAYNLMAAQLTAARAEAVQSEAFSGVHVQFAADGTRRDIKNACFTSMVRYSGGSNGTFGSIPGYMPRRMPGSIGFGEIPGTSSKFIDSGTGDFKSVDGDLNTQSNLDDFSSFTVVFSPGGAAVRQTPLNDPGNPNRTGNIFFNAGDPLFSGTTKLWESTVANGSGDGECPATAMTLFDYAELKKASDPAVYLNENAQYLPVNVHTGQLFPRE